MLDEGLFASKLWIIELIRELICSAPFTLLHVKSIPSKMSFPFGRSPFSKWRYSINSPRDWEAPKPWLLCMLRLRPAISV